MIFALMALRSLPADKTQSVFDVLTFLDCLLGCGQMIKREWTK